MSKTQDSAVKKGFHKTLSYLLIISHLIWINQVAAHPGGPLESQNSDDSNSPLKDRLVASRILPKHSINLEERARGVFRINFDQFPSQPCSIEYFDSSSSLIAQAFISNSKITFQSQSPFHFMVESSLNTSKKFVCKIQGPLTFSKEVRAAAAKIHGRSILIKSLFSIDQRAKISSLTSLTIDTNGTVLAGEKMALIASKIKNLGTIEGKADGYLNIRKGKAPEKASDNALHNIGSFLIHGNFISDGDIVNDQGTLFTIGGIWQQKSRTIILDGNVNAGPFALFDLAGKAEFSGRFHAGTAQISSRSLIICKPSASFDINYHLALNASHTLNFEGEILNRPFNHEESSTLPLDLQKLSQSVSKGIYFTAGIKLIHNGQIIAKHGPVMMESNGRLIHNKITESGLNKNDSLFLKAKELLDAKGQLTSHNRLELASEADIKLRADMKAISADLTASSNISVEGGQSNISETLVINAGKGLTLGEKASAHAKNIVLDAKEDIKNSSHLEAQSVRSRSQSFYNWGEISGRNLHFRTDRFFMNLFGGVLNSDESIEIDSLLSLNLLAWMSSQNLNINALFDLNLLGGRCAQQTQINSLLSLNAGISLPRFGSWEGLFNWDNVVSIGQTLAMSLAPSGVSQIYGMGNTLLNWVKREFDEEKSQFKQLMDSASMLCQNLDRGLSDIISFISSTKKFVLDTIPIFNLSGVTQSFVNAYQQGQLLECFLEPRTPTPMILSTIADNIGPHYNSDSLISFNFSGNVGINGNERSLYNFNCGANVFANSYTLDNAYGTNLGAIAASKVRIDVSNYTTTGGLFGISGAIDGHNLRIGGHTGFYDELRGHGDDVTFTAKVLSPSSSLTLQASEDLRCNSDIQVKNAKLWSGKNAELKGSIQASEEANLAGKGQLRVDGFTLQAEKGSLSYDRVEGKVLTLKPTESFTVVANTADLSQSVVRNGNVTFNIRGPAHLDVDAENAKTLSFLVQNESTIKGNHQADEVKYIGAKVDEKGDLRPQDMTLAVQTEAKDVLIQGKEVIADGSKIQTSTGRLFAEELKASSLTLEPTESFNVVANTADLSQSVVRNGNVTFNIRGPAHLDVNAEKAKKLTFVVQDGSTIKGNHQADEVKYIGAKIDEKDDLRPQDMTLAVQTQARDVSIEGKEITADGSKIQTNTGRLFAEELKASSLTLEPTESFTVVANAADLSQSVVRNGNVTFDIRGPAHLDVDAENAKTLSFLVQNESTIKGNHQADEVKYIGAKVDEKDDLRPQDMTLAVQTEAKNVLIQGKEVIADGSKIQTNTGRLFAEELKASSLTLEPTESFNVVANTADLSQSVVRNGDVTFDIRGPAHLDVDAENVKTLSFLVQNESTIKGNHQAKEVEYFSATVDEEGKIVKLWDMTIDTVTNAKDVKIIGNKTDVKSPESMHAETLYYENNIYEGDAAGVFQLAHQFSSVENLIMMASHYHLTNQEARTFEKYRDFTFASIDNQARINSQGGLSLISRTFFRTSADIRAQGYLFTSAEEGEHQTLSGAVLKSEHGTNSVYGSSGVKLSSNVSTSRKMVFEKGKKGKTKPVVTESHEVTTAGIVGKNVIINSGGNFENNGGSVKALGGDISTDIKGGVIDNVLKYDRRNTKIWDVNRNQQSPNGHARAQFSYLQPQYIGNLKIELEGQLSSQAGIYVSIGDGFIKAKGGMDFKSFSEVFVRDEGSKRSGWLRNKKEKWRYEDADFYTSELGSLQGSLDLASDDGGINFEGARLYSHNKGSMTAKGQIHFGAHIVEVNFFKNKREFLSKSETKGKQEVAQVLECSGTDQFEVRSNQSNLTGEGAILNFTKGGSVYGEKGVKLGPLALRQNIKTSKSGFYAKWLGSKTSETFHPTAQSFSNLSRCSEGLTGILSDIGQLASQGMGVATSAADAYINRRGLFDWATNTLNYDSVTVGFRKHSNQTKSTSHQFGSIGSETGAIEFGAGEGAEVDLSGTHLNLNGLNLNSEKLILGGAHNQYESVSQNSDTSLTFNALRGGDIGLSHAEGKSRDSGESVQHAIINIGKFRNLKNGAQVKLTDGKVNIGEASGEMFDVHVQDTQNTHNSKGHHSSIGISYDLVTGNVTSASIAYGKHNLTSSTVEKQSSFIVGESLNLRHYSEERPKDSHEGSALTISIQTPQNHAAFSTPITVQGQLGNQKFRVQPIIINADKVTSNWENITRASQVLSQEVTREGYKQALFEKVVEESRRHGLAEEQTQGTAAEVIEAYNAIHNDRDESGNNQARILNSEGRIHLTHTGSLSEAAASFIYAHVKDNNNAVYNRDPITAQNIRADNPQLMIDDSQNGLRGEDSILSDRSDGLISISEDLSSPTDDASTSINDSKQELKLPGEKQLFEDEHSHQHRTLYEDNPSQKFEDDGTRSLAEDLPQTLPELERITLSKDLDFPQILRAFNEFGYDGRDKEYKFVFGTLCEMTYDENDIFHKMDNFLSNINTTISGYFGSEKSVYKLRASNSRDPIVKTFYTCLAMRAALNKSVVDFYLPWELDDIITLPSKGVFTIFNFVQNLKTYIPIFDLLWQRSMTSEKSLDFCLPEKHYQRNPLFGPLIFIPETQPGKDALS